MIVNRRGKPVELIYCPRLHIACLMLSFDASNGTHHNVSTCKAKIVRRCAPNLMSLLGWPGLRPAFSYHLSLQKVGYCRSGHHSVVRCRPLLSPRSWILMRVYLPVAHPAQRENELTGPPSCQPVCGAVRPAKLLSGILGRLETPRRAQRC